MLVPGRFFASLIAAVAGAGWLAAATAGVCAALLVLVVYFLHVCRLKSQELKILKRQIEWNASALRAAEARAAETRDHLELRVLERTADLANANSELQAEILNRKRIEATLRASEERYRDLFDNASDCVFTTGLDGSFRTINRTGCDLFGYTVEEALQMNAFDLVVPEHRDFVRSMVGKKLDGEAGTTYQADLLTKSGRRLTLDFNTRLAFENGRPAGIQGIARDITERKALEEQLRQAQKMEAIGQLAGGVAHDFNNLLTIVWSYGQMTLDEAPPESPLAEYAQEILLAAQRGSALTSRLLSFSRRQVVQPRVVNLNDIITGLGGMLRRLVGEHIEIQTVLAPGLPNVKVDPAQIEQVLLNLIVNARDAMPEGGMVRIQTTPVPGAADLLVSDTGHGMDSQVLAHLFEPFFTTKAPGKGTGLGLSIVYGIVRQSGGSIAVDSSPGHGASFRICLPAASECAQSLAPQLPQPGPGGTHGGTVLIAEDEQDLRNLVKRVLAQAGYSVLEAQDGVGALEVLRSHAGKIDLLLTDIVMPRLSGRELVQQTSTLRPGMRVVYMTGYTEDPIVRQEIEKARVPVLHKPFRPETLLSAVEAALNGKSEA